MGAERLELSVIPAETLTRLRESWAASATMPARGLLRLDLLRGLVRAVHAERSRCLATGKREEAAQLKSWEKRLEELRQLAPLDGELDPILVGGPSAPPLKRRSRLPPQALNQAIGPDRLNRYDRQWESALASEACAAGWKLWTLDAWVEIPRAEEWNAKLSSRLWPAGIVLFVETSPIVQRGAEMAVAAGAPGTSRTSGPVPLPLWPGHWTIAARPDLEGLDPALEDVRTWPGYPSASPENPRWKLLFAPKTG